MGYVSWLGRVAIGGSRGMSISRSWMSISGSRVGISRSWVGIGRRRVV